MPQSQRVVVVPTMNGYVPKDGWRIISYSKLSDGSYEVLLEPPGFPS